MKTIVLLSGLFGAALWAAAAGGTAREDRKTEHSPAAERAVDLFAAIDAGDIDVKLVLKDSTGGTVTIANKTKQPLTIKLPEAFAGVPVLAQLGGLGGGNGNGNNRTGGGNQMNQGFGGGMMGGMGGGMMGGMGGMMGGRGGFISVPASKIGKLKVVGVCLDHGKNDPNPYVTYDVKPIETLTKDPELIEVITMIGHGEVRQHAGQAVAWHLANQLSWSFLSGKIGVKHLNGSTEPYFTSAELAYAVQIGQEATNRVENRKSDSRTAEAATKKSPGQSIQP